MHPSLPPSQGSGGVLTTLSAFIVNPPRNGGPVGRPVIGGGLVSLGSGRALIPKTISRTTTRRFPAWAANKHLTIAAGYGYFGNVGDRNAPGVWGLTAKYEF